MGGARGLGRLGRIPSHLCRMEFVFCLLTFLCGKVLVQKERAGPGIWVMTKGSSVLAVLGLWEVLPRQQDSLAFLNVMRSFSFSLPVSALGFMCSHPAHW